MHGTLNRVPWPSLDALVKQHHCDKHVRKLPTKTQLVVLAYAQMAGIAGLREAVPIGEQS